MPLHRASGPPRTQGEVVLIVDGVLLPHWRVVPVMGNVEGELVLMAAVELGGVLVEIVEIAGAQVAVVEEDSVVSVVGNALVIHGGVRRIVDVVVPLIESEAQGRGLEALRKLIGEEQLIDAAAVPFYSTLTSAEGRPI